MVVETLDAEELANSQSKAIASFFGTEVPPPGDWLFEVIDTNRKEKLFAPDMLVPLYLPHRQLAEGVSFPGLTNPLDPWIYRVHKNGRIDRLDADWLPGEWVLFDVARRPNYDAGRQMYDDTPRFREMLATLREEKRLKVPRSSGSRLGGQSRRPMAYYAARYILACRGSYLVDLRGRLRPNDAGPTPPPPWPDGRGRHKDFKHVRPDSRFALSGDEIDRRPGVVARAVADILHLRPEQVGTPSCAAFNYVGNLAHPEFGEVDTWEWLKEKVGRAYRLRGGSSDYGGLSRIFGRWIIVRSDRIGFRLQISSPG